MADGPESIGEVARLIKNLEQHLDRRFNAIEQRQDRLVSAEVYDRDRLHIDRRIDDLLTAINKAREDATAGLAHEEQERKIAAANNGNRMDRMETRWKWLVAVVLVPIALTVFNVLRDAGT